MTSVLVTVDTELSALLHKRGFSARANLESSIVGRCRAGDFGIGWQMDRLEAQGLKGVFFVDPMPALVHGEALIADIVGPIIARGHEVQLHIHTEWLEWVQNSPVGGRLGQNLRDFSPEDQATLLGLATDLIAHAGAPRPTAFRAGNYGADDNSLIALARLGLTWDSSVNAPYLGGSCRISASPDQIGAIKLHDMIELPIAGLHDRPQHIRPAQICALSAVEMRAALDHAARHRHPAFVIVTHSFEMLSRDRMRPNRAVMRRFDQLCRAIASHPGLNSAGFGDLDPAIIDTTDTPMARLAPNIWRTGWRVIEQALMTWRYERQLRPA